MLLTCFLCLAATEGVALAQARVASVQRASSRSAGTADVRLVEAVKTGNDAATTALLRQHVSANSAEPDGTTALHWAVRENDVPLVERLLRAGANPNAANRYGITPIYLACQNGSAPVVSRLLKGGVSANATGPFGETALMTCARTGVVDAAAVLIEAGASVDAIESWRGQTALMWAAAEGHPDMIRALVAAGADVNARSAIQNWERQRTLEPRDKWLPPGGLTPLLFAARQGCVECERVLLDAKADINIVDPQQHTALVLALENGHYDAAALLIERGADVNQADAAGQTPLYAAVNDHTMPTSNRPSPKEIDNRHTGMDVIAMLLEHGATVDAALRAQVPYRTKLDRGGDGVLGVGTTPLIRAAKAADTAVIKLLLEHGANAKAATRNRVSAVMIAANVNAREEDMTGRGKTESDIIDSIKLLLAAGADVKGAEVQGRTALHGAAQWGLTGVVKFLASQGGDINAADRRGFTPLDYSEGRAGGFGFDGKASVVHEDTAKAIRELGGQAGTPTGTALPPRRPNGAQDDPN